MRAAALRGLLQDGMEGRPGAQRLEARDQLRSDCLAQEGSWGRACKRQCGCWSQGAEGSGQMGEWEEQGEGKLQGETQKQQKHLRWLPCSGGGGVRSRAVEWRWGENVSL